MDNYYDDRGNVIIDDLDKSIIDTYYVIWNLVRITYDKNMTYLLIIYMKKY